MFTEIKTMVKILFIFYQVAQHIQCDFNQNSVFQKKQSDFKLFVEEKMA